MLFHSAFRKELARSFGATLVVLVTVVMTVMLIRTLGQASVGVVNPSEIMLVMGYTVLGQLSTILTLSLFIAATATLTRMYASSEMVVWFSCGQGLLSFLRPLLRFAWPMLAAIALLALLAWPWSNAQIRELRDRYQGRGDVDRVAPGQFQESAGGQRVFFIDKQRPDDQTGSNIFIAASEKSKESVTSARGGRVATLNGERVLILEQGQRLETDLASGESRLSEFAEYGTRIGQQPASQRANLSPRYQSTWALLQDFTPAYASELWWRVSLLLAAINCLVLALAATRVNPRAGRSASLVFAMLAFATYYNLLNVGQSWIARERIGLPALLLLVHGGVLALSLAWIWWRQGERPRWMVAARTGQPA
ncbi:MAG: LPS export ABC transporter permease LptF [Burkholderiaceae bacterium]|jgi:lipopolysaccharide export system permease protein|nr:LPS export ABC transporter permease LptF [Burkholderiaceae bacterium]